MILEYVSPKVLAEWAQAQQALLQELIRESQAQEAQSGADAQEPLLTPDELAQSLKVPVSWVYEQSRLGNLPTHRLGRYIRFRLSEVLAHPATNDALARRRDIAETTH